MPYILHVVIACFRNVFEGLFIRCFCSYYNAMLMNVGFMGLVAGGIFSSSNLIFSFRHFI